MNDAGTTYDKLGKCYDTFTLPLEGFVLERMRRGLLAKATGSVLEIGVGTGKNLEHYPRKVDRILGVDISRTSLDVACSRADTLGKTFQPFLGDATSLPFDDDSFDTVVCTLVGCTFDEPLAAFREMRRLCQPDGRVLFLEHTVTDSVMARGLLTAVRPLARARLHCDATRDNWKLIHEAGFEIDQLATAVFGILIGVVAKP